MSLEEFTAKAMGSNAEEIHSEICGTAEERAYQRGLRDRHRQTERKQKEGNRD